MKKHLFFKSLLVLVGVLITSLTTQTWATARTFKSGEKIYFKDASGNITWGDLNCLWKVSNGNVYAYFWNDTEGQISAWATTKYGTVNQANTIYEITVPGSGKEYTHVLFTRGDESNKWWNQTLDQNPDVGYNLFCIANDGDYNGSRNPTHKWKGNWSRYAHNGAVVGSFNDWNPDTYPLSNSGVAGALIPLEASTTYNFKILLGETYYGINSASTITSTLTDWWTFYSGQGNVPITTDVAGDYGFAWNASSRNVTVYYPKALYQKSKYIYFDVTRETYWNANPFTARFYLKYFDSGSNLDGMPLTCSTPVEDYVYYAQVPDNGYIGQIQMNRYYNGNIHGIADVAYVYNRSSSSQNCLKEQSGKENYENSWTPQWTTYCPPMSTASLSDNSTTVISWTSGNGTYGSPYLVKTGTSIKVSADATSAVPDPDMTKKFDFKVDGTSQQDGTTSTYSHTASTNNHLYSMTVDAYNYYNSTSGTKNTPSAKYYKALNTYSVTHTIPNVTKTNGRSGDDAAAYNLDYTATYTANTGYTLPDAVTVTIGGATKTVTTDYTWSVSDGTGILTILTDKINGDVVITVNAVANTYTGADNLNKNTGDYHGKYTATYDAKTIEINTTPTKENYHVEGYYLESGCTTKIADASGNLLPGVVKDAVTYTDGEGKWKKTTNVELYTKWEENNFMVTINAGSHGSVSTTSITGHPITASDNFTVTADAGYAFSHWTFSAAVADTNYVSTGGTNNATQTFNVTTTAAVTMTANYVVRYGLYGSLDNELGDNEYGMPGWGVSADFTYSAGTYTCSRSLTKPNENYKFRVLDRRDNTSWGYTSSNHIINENTATTLSGNYDAKLSTAGRGSYTFTVTEVDAGAYPQVSISNPTSYLVHFGKKAFSYEGDDLGDLDATITVTDAAGNTYADGKYIASGETVTVTASDIPAGYNLAGWWNSSSYTGAYFANANPTFWTVSEAVNAYAKFIEDAKIFNAATDNKWSTTTNWTGESLPSITDVVYINAPVNVDVQTAKAKRVIIHNDGSNTYKGKLTVNAGMKLIVAETIKKYDGSSFVATTENDLIIDSDGSNGVGALIWGTENTSPGAATVNFYSISGGAKDNKASVNQFIGTPFTSETSSWLYNYYNSWVLGVDYSGTKPAFTLLGGNDTMDPFKGYCIIYNGSTGHTYNMSGTLVTNADHTCSSLSYKSGDASNMANENLLANPWLAPIKINALQSSDFTNAPATIYIFNSISEEGNSNSKSVAIGNYTVYSLGTAGNNVIPAMQSFSVFTTAANGSVALDYSKIVYGPAVDGINPSANKAPKRVAEEEANKVRLFVSAESGYGDMVYMWEHANFNDGFENGWDAHKIYGDKEAPQFYALTPDGNMSINCVPTFEGTVMGFKAGTEDDTYTFSFEYDEENAPLYLYDMNTQTYTRVLSGNTYMFTTTDKDAHNRFSLTHNAPSTATGIGNNWLQGEGTKAVKFIENGKLFILQNGRLYDATGALVK